MLMVVISLYKSICNNLLSFLIDLYGYFGSEVCICEEDRFLCFCLNEGNEKLWEFWNEYRGGGDFGVIVVELIIVDIYFWDVCGRCNFWVIYVEVLFYERRF